MRSIQRLAAVGVLATLIGACGTGPQPPAPPPLPEREPAPPSSVTPAPSVTTIDDVAGPGCAQLPAEGPGSAQDMADAPVGIAAERNPLLDNLSAVVAAAKLGDTLNSLDGVTVFAPINSAFDELSAGTVRSVATGSGAAQPTDRLATMVTTHLVGGRYDAEGLRAAGTVVSAQGSPLTTGGAAPEALTVSSGGVSANVVCANVPTANATVFLIDKVLRPAG